MVEKGGASGRFVKEQEVSLKCVLAPINKLVNHRLDIIYDFRSEEVLLEYVQEWISFSKSRRLPSAVYSANVHVWKKDACETSRFADWNHKPRVNCFHITCNKITKYREKVITPVLSLKVMKN